MWKSKWRYYLKKCLNDCMRICCFVFLRMRQLVKRLNEHIDDAVAIFAIHYGEDCSQVEDLYRLRSALGIHPHSTTIRGMAPL